MIIDQLRNVQSGFYPALLSATDADGLAQRFAKAFHFLQTADLENAEPGRVDIDGDQIFALIQEYNTKPLAQGFWEAHRKYIDIQLSNPSPNHRLKNNERKRGWFIIRGR
jgi:beta-galactosidase beta subunit